MNGLYFGFEENPFNLTPDPGYLFLSSQHSEALNLLSYGIFERKGFIAITGDVGTGKTTLCRALFDRLDDTTKTAVLLNSPDSALELLETINREFGIYEKTASKRKLLETLYQYLLRNYMRGHNTVLVVDEAQNLSPAVLEQIRMLSNLETEKDKLIQIALLGQPELLTLLSKPSLRQLKERITLWHHLAPLDKKEVRDYIKFRLSVAGAPDDNLFLDPAIKRIFAYSRGNPRIINAVCDRALLIGYSKDELFINKNAVLKAIDDIQGRSRAYWSLERLWFQNRFAPAIAVVLILLVVLNMGPWKNRLSSLFSLAERVAVLQGQALIQSPSDWQKVRPQQKTVSVAEIAMSSTPFTEQEPMEAVTVDERTSLAELFRLFDVQAAQQAFASSDVYPGLFTFKGDPELYRKFAKPFRLRVKPDPGSPSRYLLIREVTTEGAIAVDEKGDESPVPNDWILSYWDGEISWIYPHEYAEVALSEGMTGLEILKVQHMLTQLGYSVDASGVYGTDTTDEIARFQLNHSLQASGIVDGPTKALLYQVSG